jgi:hypothetical protein
MMRERAIGQGCVLRQYRGDYLKRVQEGNTDISKPKDFTRDNKRVGYLVN